MGRDRSRLFRLNGTSSAGMPHPHARGMPLRPRAGLHAAPRGAGRELHRRSQPTPEARPWARSAQHHSTGAQGPAGRPPFTTPPHAQHRALPPPTGDGSAAAAAAAAPLPSRSAPRGLTSAAGMFTTPVDLLFSLSFLFSICPFPFLALGPELFPLAASFSSPSGEPGAAEAEAAAAGGGLAAGSAPRPPARAGGGGSLPGAARPKAAAARLTQLTAPPAGGAGRSGGAAGPPGGRLLFSSAEQAPPAGRDSPPAAAPGAVGACFARIFSRLAFHSSRKSVVLPPALR